MSGSVRDNRGEILLPNPLHKCDECNTRVKEKTIATSEGFQGITACECGPYSVETPVLETSYEVQRALCELRGGPKTPAKVGARPRVRVNRGKTIEEYKEARVARKLAWNTA